MTAIGFKPPASSTWSSKKKFVSIYCTFWKPLTYTGTFTMLPGVASTSATVMEAVGVDLACNAKESKAKSMRSRFDFIVFKNFWFMAQTTTAKKRLHNGVKQTPALYSLFIKYHTFFPGVLAVFSD